MVNASDPSEMFGNPALQSGRKEGWGFSLLRSQLVPVRDDDIAICQCHPNSATAVVVRHTVTPRQHSSERATSTFFSNITVVRVHNYHSRQESIFTPHGSAKP